MGIFYASHKTITTQDYCRLSMMASVSRKPDYLRQKLKLLLEKATVVAADSVPGNVVTMNSRMHLKDIRNGEVQTVELIYRGDTSGVRSRIKNVPVLTHLGLLLLGQREGDLLVNRICIQSLLFQPESERKIG